MNRKVDVDLHVTHDNGNQVCLSDGSVWSRQDQMFHDANGFYQPEMTFILTALLGQERKVWTA